MRPDRAAVEFLGGLQRRHTPHRCAVHDRVVDCRRATITDRARMHDDRAPPAPHALGNTLLEIRADDEVRLGPDRRADDGVVRRRDRGDHVMPT